MSTVLHMSSPSWESSSPQSQSESGHKELPLSKNKHTPSQQKLFWRASHHCCLPLVSSPPVFFSLLGQYGVSIPLASCIKRNKKYKALTPVVWVQCKQWSQTQTVQFYLMDDRCDVRGRDWRHWSEFKAVLVPHLCSLLTEAVLPTMSLECWGWYLSVHKVSSFTASAEQTSLSFSNICQETKHLKFNTLHQLWGQKWYLTSRPLGAFDQLPNYMPRIFLRIAVHCSVIEMNN